MEEKLIAGEAIIRNASLLLSFQSRQIPKDDIDAILQFLNVLCRRIRSIAFEELIAATATEPLDCLVRRFEKLGLEDKFEEGAEKVIEDLIGRPLTQSEYARLRPIISEVSRHHRPHQQS
jgi:hypothetical protein